MQHQSNYFMRSRSGPSSRHGNTNVRPSFACSAVVSQRIKLGDSDLNVSPVCLGTMTFGKQNDEEEAHDQLDFYEAQGGNFLDSAEMYPIPTAAETQGSTDRFIGTWLAKDKRRRGQTILATKVSGYSERLSYLRKPPRTTRVERVQIKESVEDSLKRLGTDYIDLLQIHWPDRYVGGSFGAPAFDITKERSSDVPFEEQLRAFEELVREGKVRYIGVSNETSYGVSEFSHLHKTLPNLPKIISIQNSYSLLVRVQYETDLAETCLKHNVGLLAYSPLAGERYRPSALPTHHLFLSGGSLSNKYNDGSSTEKDRFNLFPGYMARYSESLVKQAVGEYAALAVKYGMTPSELALAWCHSRWFVASTIIGATSLKQLKENVGAFEKKLPDECVAEINLIYKKFRDPTLF